MMNSRNNHYQENKTGMCFYSQNQSPQTGSNQSPNQKTQLVLKVAKQIEGDQKQRIIQHKVQQSMKTIKTQSGIEMDLKKQLQIQISMYKELSMKYELSIKEIQQYQMTIERLNQKRNHEKQQLQSELNSMKKQIEHRSKSQLELHENGMLGHIVNEMNHKSGMKDITELKEKCKHLTQELETKNIQLDYLTKKLLTSPCHIDLQKQIKELNEKLVEKENKLQQQEEQLRQLDYCQMLYQLNYARNKSRYLLKTTEYFQINKKILDQDQSTYSNQQSTMSHQIDNLSYIPQSYIKL